YGGLSCRFIDHARLREKRNCGESVISPRRYPSQQTSQRRPFDRGLDISGTRAASLDYLVGGGEQRRRNLESARTSWALRPLSYSGLHQSTLPLREVRHARRSTLRFICSSTLSRRLRRKR